MLGQRTKQFKSYGKRKTNVVNYVHKTLWTDDDDNDGDDDGHSQDEQQSVKTQPPPSFNTARKHINTVDVDKDATKAHNNNDDEFLFNRHKNQSKTYHRRRPVLVVVADDDSDIDTHNKENRTNINMVNKSLTNHKQRARPFITRQAKPSTTTSTTTRRAPLRPTAQTTTTAVYHAGSKARDNVEPDSDYEPVNDAMSSMPTAHRTRRVTRRTIIQSDDDDDDSSVIIENSKPSFQDDTDTKSQFSSFANDDDNESTSAQTNLSTLDNERFKPILDLCMTSSILEFETFVKQPPIELFNDGPAIKMTTTKTNTTWQKIGEASYSEVFQTRDVVVKVIPVNMGTTQENIENHRKDKADDDDNEEDESPYLSDVDLVRREILVSSIVGGRDSSLKGFVRFKGALLVQGAYPDTLLRQWDTFKRRYPDTDEQIRPHVLPSNQIYAIICLDNAGVALEDFKVISWQQAMSVFVQVVQICAEAEKRIEFEHRDLHWGNILIRPAGLDKTFENLSLIDASDTNNQRRYEACVTGVEAMLIDFTLSRVCYSCPSKTLQAQTNLNNNSSKHGTKEILFDPFDDECIFEGRGDYQFDVYRDMKRYVGNDWQSFKPLTNVMWLHYLTTKLLKDKKLKKPNQTISQTSNRTNKTRKSSKSTTRPISSLIECQAYQDLIKIEKTLDQVLRVALNKNKSISKSKFTMQSATDVWTWLQSDIM
ncbi:hypothetical protein OIO90_000935 [Microbotryomycetes sp. JL221]|nr:hypothetical protein OIO90_000935 [Microbotryomycetes sp. JL221]